jgi:hypothetical protein
MRSLHFSWLIASLVTAVVSTSWAGQWHREAAVGCASDGCRSAEVCSHCGCAAARKVCRLIKIEKEITVTCYGVKCEEICVPSPGSDCISAECVVCGDDSSCRCGEKAICKARYATGKPGCAKPKCVKQLVKYELTKKVPAYEWEVVCLCSACSTGCSSDNSEPAAPAEAAQAYDPAPLAPW